MIIKTIYRFYKDGSTIVSPIKPDADYTETYRIIAEDGMAITNGSIECECIDTDDTSAWHDCEPTTMREEEKLAKVEKIHDILTGVTE